MPVASSSPPRVYGPLFTAGLHYWQLGESHYWGHNAIIRVDPFIKHCALAPLPGEGSFAGSILSHDFVEAALMRRAGWGVWIAYDLPGSYEELPPNLLDELKRDRRWCQGNLMNFRLFLVKGMHPVHRAVFLTGVMSYLSAPLWFMFLALSTALQVVHTLMEPQYFLQPRQLFPVWPQWRPELAVALFSTTMVLLFLPKLLSVILICAQRRETVRRGFYPVLFNAAGDVVFRIAGAGPHAVSYHLCGQRVSRLVGSVELAAAGRRCNALERSFYAARFANAAGGWSGPAAWPGWTCVSCGGCPLSCFR